MKRSSSEEGAAPPLEDVINWDVINWGRGFSYLLDSITVPLTNIRVLELGAHKGGISLHFAMQGAHVLCSEFPLAYGFEHLQEQALHKRYRVQDRIWRAGLDATSLGIRTESIDLVVFKSVLGGIARDGREDLQEQVVSEVRRVLRPGGSLLVLEGLKATPVHRVLRETFIRWGRSWHYPTMKEAVELFGCFSSFSYKTFGFLGTLGRTEPQRRMLGRLDSVIDPLLPSSVRYILAGIARK